VTAGATKQERRQCNNETATDCC